MSAWMSAGRGALAIALALTPAAGARAEDRPDAETRLARQEEQIRKLSERLDRQEQEIARLRAAAAAPPPKAEETWTSAIRLSGYAQVDAVLYRGTSRDEVSPGGAPLNQNRFLLRRARLRADLGHGAVTGVVELDGSTLNGPMVRVLDAEVAVRWQGPDAAGPPLIAGRIGLFKIPFGAEVPALETAQLFLERTTAARAFFPGNYDLGAGLLGGYRFVRYSLAIMNGQPIGEAQFPAVDPNAGKDFVGRLGVDTSVGDRVRVEAGGSLLSGQGFRRGTPSTKDVLVWRDANENGLVEITEIQAITGAAATPSGSFHRFAIGADLRVTAVLPVLGALSISGEIARAQNLDRGVEPADPVILGRDLRELGFHVAITQEITRWAMIGARYDRYDPDADASEQRGVARVPKESAYSTLAVAAALRYGPGRLIAEYDHNENALGRALSGLPATLGDDAFTLRAEVVIR